MRHLPLLTRLNRRFLELVFRRSGFRSSTSYWERRYRSGGTSGAGSYNHLAVFKAEVINAFVKRNNVASVIEYGCGDGNQLQLAQYHDYVGFDVSAWAVRKCRDMFKHDSNKRFKLIHEYSRERAQLTLSLDVIYHLVEDQVFEEYMERLFDSAERFVIIYSSNAAITSAAPHVRHRHFSDWISQHRPEWLLIQHIPNRHPFSGDEALGSFAAFYIYGR